VFLPVALTFFIKVFPNNLSFVAPLAHR
jgi:hypothetical protein